MLLQIGVRVPDVHDPLGLLAASLRRHLSRLRALNFASAHLVDGDAERSEQAAEGLRDALSFFARAASDPFRDEAEVLFPWLRSRMEGDSELEQHLASLTADRARAEALHATAAEHGEALAKGELTTTHLLKLGLVAEELEELYRAHLERLEVAVFPRAQTLLQESERGQLGERMLRTAPATVVSEGASEREPAYGLP